MKRLLALLLLLASPALAANNYVVPDATGTFKVLGCVENSFAPIVCNYAMAPYPSGATPITAASGNVANASAVATLSGAANVLTYISGFQCTAAGSTGALVVNLTVGGVVTGTMTYTFIFPAGVTVAAAPVIVKFDPPVPASAVNTSIVVTLPAGGAGNTNAACNAQGYRL